MPQLSVIIVNYNVKHFLEQCLCSVAGASAGMDAEVIVVDNHSQDGSLDYLVPRFPRVRFIANEQNAGFAKACNQGWRAASGKYILFLNPDTIVPEDCFSKCLSFMEIHPDAGALGIRMLDGGGRFLKESKRAFPAPLTSLYKLFGLARLFPRSRVFSKYHLGHLDEMENNEVDVLAGAFMLVKKEVMDQAGGFDETFFMYGEDVDLSYRIQQAGYKNYYFADSAIIHFKGESTRKGSMNYVRMFYHAMSLFVKKHYGAGRARMFQFLIHLAIWFRAAMTTFAQFIRKAGLPLMDAGLILLAFWLVKSGWNLYIRRDIHYEPQLLWIAFPAYTLFFLLAAYYAGLYDKWYKWTGLVRSMLIATVLLLAAYSLLPEQYRFSRGIILFGAVLAFIFISLLRVLLLSAGILRRRNGKKGQAILVAGTRGEYGEAVAVLKQAGMGETVLGRIAPEENESDSIGTLPQLPKLAATIPFKEIIFCAGTLSYARIIGILPMLPSTLTARIHARGSGSMVGSRSKDRAGDFFSIENGFALHQPYNRRLKRLTDVAVSVLLLLTFPVHVFGVQRPLSFFRNCFAVLFAKKTWIGYSLPVKSLPPLRPAVIGTHGRPLPAAEQLPGESLERMDHWYARDYDPVDDLKRIRRAYRLLGG